MQYRGPILIVFACSLVLSPLAIKRMQALQAAGNVSTGIETQNAAAADCARGTIVTSSYAIGCGARAARITGRVALSGSNFVTARN